MNINFEYYKIFYYVAKYHNFTKAAKVLESSQPNVTRAMNCLEQQMHSTLFVRTNRGVQLTPEGEKLYMYVSAAMHQLLTAEEELADYSGMVHGSISIGASETALNIYLFDKLRSFHTAYPGIRLRIYNHSTPEAVESVKNGLADFAVVTTPLQAKKPLKSTSLMSFKEIAVGDHSFQGKEKPIRLKDLIENPLISLGQGSTTYEFYSKFFLENDLVLSPDTEVETIDQVLPLIMNGLGIGFLPELFVRPVIEERKVCQIPLKENIPERKICLVENHTFPPSIAAEMFKKMLVLK